MISFARIAVLEPALLSIVPNTNTQHIGCISNWFHMELFEELFNRSEAAPLPGLFQKDLVVLERLLGEPCPSLSLPELIHSPE